MSAGPESASHTILAPQHIGTYFEYAPTSCGPNLAHLANPLFDVLL